MSLVLRGVVVVAEARQLLRKVLSLIQVLHLRELLRQPTANDALVVPVNSTALSILVVLINILILHETLAIVVLLEELLRHVAEQLHGLGRILVYCVVPFEITQFS